jgi:aldose 1-epimerase
MFKHDIDLLSDNKKLILTHEKSGFEAVIDLDNGASLVELTVHHTTIIKRLIEPRPVDIHYSSFLFPFVNRLDAGKFRFRENEYQFPINEPENNNAIHGLLADQPFEIKNIQCDEASAAIELSYTYNGDKSYFPFPFDIQITYAFSLNAVQVGITAINTGHQEFPFSLGWHPYFNLPDKDGNYLSFDTLQLVSVDKRCIPIRMEAFQKSLRLNVFKDRIDDCYKLKSPTCFLKTSDYELCLSSNEESSYLQIYHPPHTDRVAMEPLTGITDCFNNGIGLRVLAPNTSFSQIYKVDIKTFARKELS